MKIHKLTLKNIRSYQHQEINFPEGTLLLAGDVGTGKTSLLLAIEYALFGLQPGQRGSALLRNTSDTGEVTLHLELKGQDILIERRLKRSQKSITNEYAAITINNEKQELSVSEMKTKIIQLLNYPDEFIKKNNILYRYTIYTPQEQMKQIISEDPETRLNVLRHIFGIDKYKYMQENITILLQHFKEDIKEMMGQISSLEQERLKLKEIETKLIILKEQEKIKYEELKAKQNKKQQLESELKQLEEKSKQREDIKKEIEKTMILQTAKQEQLNSLSKDLQEIEQILSSQPESFNEGFLEDIALQLIEKKNALDTIHQQYHALFAQQTNLNSQTQGELNKKERIFKIDICPTCLQNVSDMHKHNILNEVENTIARMKKQQAEFETIQKKLQKEIEQCSLECAKLEKRRLALEVLKAKQEDIKRSEKKLESINKEKQALKKDFDFLEQHLSSLKENLLAFSTFETALKKKQEESKQANTEERDAEIALAQLKKEFELMQHERTRTEAGIAEKEKTKQKLAEKEALCAWIGDKITALLSYIEHQVLLTLRQEFSHLFRKWFQILAGESFDVRLDENFTPIIMQGDIEMEYSFLSGGERTAIALAYRLALNQVINSVLSNIQTKDVIILDEPTEGFSSAQILKMRDIFSELNVVQLIIVSHEPQIEDFVDHIIHVKKEGSISFLEPREPQNLNISENSPIYSFNNSHNE